MLWCGEIHQGITVRSEFFKLKSRISQIQWEKFTNEVAQLEDNSLHHGIRVPSSENIKQRVMGLQLFVPQLKRVTRVKVPLDTISIYLQRTKIS